MKSRNTLGDKLSTLRGLLLRRYFDIRELSAAALLHCGAAYDIDGRGVLVQSDKHQ